MSLKKDLKVLARSGSWRFMRDCRHKGADGSEAVYQWHGNPIHYRPGTSDADIVYNILLKTGRKAEYYVPRAIDPKVILDIGANIGMTSVYLADRFPEAQVHAFEPVPDNFALLKKNTEAYPNVTAYPVALGAEDGELEIYGSDDQDNRGGFSLHEHHVDTGNKVTVQVKQADAFLSAQGIRDVDLIKIDTEGSEYAIITALDKAMLDGVSWLIGELHGIDDFRLLAYLAPGFHIGVRKTLKNRLFIFNACNRGREDL